MTDEIGMKAKRLDPKRIADGANRRFVRLAESLMCLVAWRSSRAKDLPRDARSRPARDGTLQLKLRDLFHRNAGRRLAAARWIRKRRYRQALAMLESVQAIEESAEVRREIARAILEIKGKTVEQ
jgi:hypothetical protein